MSEAGWVLIKDEKVISGPFGWNPSYMSREAKNIGICISFPIKEPKEAITIKEGIRLLPVTNIIDSHDATTQYVSNTPTITINKDNAEFYYPIQNKTQETIDAEDTAKIDEQAEIDARIDIKSLRTPLQEAKSVEDLVKILDSIITYLEQNKR